MSTPVEMIEALQKKWRKTSQIPNCNSFEEGYAKAHEWLARELAPILAAAREQEQELEKAKGQLDIIQRECEGEGDEFLANDYGGLGWEQEKPVTTVRTIRKELAHWRWLYSDHGEPKKDSKPEQTQHSADLREIAEMAIAKHKQLYYNDEKPISADSIVREFREKQKKAEVK